MDLPRQFTEKLVHSEKEKQTLMTPFLYKKDPNAMQVEGLVVAYCMNPRVAFDTMDNKYWRLAHSSSHPPGLRSRKQLTKHILEYSALLEKERMALLAGKTVGLPLDGGKDVNQ